MEKLKSISRVSAFDDLKDGIKSYKVWSSMAYQDIISRYRRSILGPFWVAAMMSTQALALAIVFGSIYGMSLKEFLPFVITGISTMLYLGVAFTEGTETYGIYRPLVQSSALPLTFHIFRMCAKHFLIYLHNLAVFFVTYFVFYHRLDVGLSIIPALLISFIFIFGATLLNSTLALRFKDYRFIIPHIWTLFFFLSPVMWKPDQIKGKIAMFNHFNPAYYLLNVIRNGLEGQATTMFDWIGALGFSLAFLAVGFGAFAIARKRIALWV